MTNVHRPSQAERIGDVAAARRWYEAAAAFGNWDAALSLGRLYDPAALRRMQILGNTSGNPGLARHWYEQAAAHGDPRAPMLLQALTSRKAGSGGLTNAWWADSVSALDCTGAKHDWKIPPFGEPGPTHRPDGAGWLARSW
jgi:TPR repeat protein